MNLLIYLLVAAIIGWVATEMMHDRSNLVINIIVAVRSCCHMSFFLQLESSDEAQDKPRNGGAARQ